MKKIIFAFLFVFVCFSSIVFAHVPLKILVQISRAEDELRYDNVLENLMKNRDAHTRARAALAAGRIGNASAIPALANILENDGDENVRATAAFSIGEIESVKGADAILNILDNLRANPMVRARAAEAAGKIAAANAKDEKSKTLGEAISSNLKFEGAKRSGPFMNVIELGLTAILRSRPENAERIVIEFTQNYTPQIRANALNTLARLRSKKADENARELLQKDEDATVRANAARVLGAAEDKDSFELLLNSAISDEDSRVRVAAIRALGNLKNAKAADQLLERGEKLFADYKKSKFAAPSEKSEILEIAAVLGNLLKNTGNEKSENYLHKVRDFDKYRSPETEIALAQIAPEKYLKEFNAKNDGLKDWRVASSYAQGLGEIARQTDENIKKRGSEKIAVFLSDILKKTPSVYRSEMNKAVPDAIRAMAAYKSENLAMLLREIIRTKDVFIRAAAAELLGEQTKTAENIKSLQIAFSSAFVGDKDYNDAQLAILDALFKLDKKEETVPVLFAALYSKDYLVRKKAFDLLQNEEFGNDDLVKMALEKYKAEKRNQVLHFSKGSKLGQKLNSEVDYVRAVSRKNGTVKAIFTTEKGNFTINLTPEDAPLTVDNFIKLAKSNYFNGVSVHRVVPNFVMQDGDPRGDGNGGPGWQIRCEINMLEFDRGAVGMALSGKDTGGSQWFVAHSPQPHLDGGYTVFGKINEADMKVVDSIARGDKILSVKIVEGKSPAKSVKE